MLTMPTMPMANSNKLIDCMPHPPAPIVVFEYVFFWIWCPPSCRYPVDVNMTLPTARHSVSSPTARHTSHSPTARHTSNSPTARHSVHSPTARHSPHSPTARHSVNSPTARHSAPTSRHSAPTIRHSAPTARHSAHTPTARPTARHSVYIVSTLMLNLTISSNSSMQSTAISMHLGQDYETM